MAGPSSRTVADRQTSIQIQTSVYGIPVSVVYGTNRVSANLVWFANFQAKSQTQKTGGKGMGGSSTSTTYTYTASAILALAEGTIDGVGDVWKDKEKTTLAALGLTLFTGSPTQTVWSFLSGYSVPGNWSYDYGFGYYGTTASFVDQAINYSGTAYLASSAYDLGDAASIPNHSFEVKGKLIFGSGIFDASPASIIPDILTSAQYGLNFASTKIDTLTSYATYCRAAGLFFSPAYTQQRATADCVQELCDSSNAAPFWSDGKLKVVPYGDATITGNGVTFTPNLTPVYDLTDDDYLETGEPPIRVSRITPADAYNRVQVQFRNRNNQYNQEVVSVEDQDAIEKYGLRTAPMITADFICEPGVAKLVAQLALQRMLYKRNQYEFELNARFAMLEPMDIVTLFDPGLGMVRLPVRLLEIQEQEDSYACIAEDLPIGVASAPIYTHDNGLRWQNSTTIPAQDVANPVIFELPSGISVTGLALAVAAGGQAGDTMYGGCRVWLSLDGLNYREEGVINGSSRYGVLTASLPTHAAGIDTTSTMSVALTSGGQMLSGSANDLATGTTQIIVGDEYLAYQNAALTGFNAYNLTTLKRGLYDTPPTAHASGTPWVRVDGAVAELANIDESMIGQTVYIKLTSFNVYGSAEQSLADVTAYSYTVTGNMKALQSDYVLGYLTNESAVVAADSAGTVAGAAWTGAGGEFKVTDGLDPVTSGVTYSVVSSTGVTIAINVSTGIYTVSAMSANTGSAILRASYKGVTIDKVYSIAKSIQGTSGVSGSNSAIAYLYQRAASTPAAPTGTFTYTFATGALSGGTPGGWSTTIPANDGNPLWVIAATASATGTTDTIAAAEFSSPVVLAANGTSGTSGLNTASVFLYQRSATAPAVPATTLTYTFATAVLSGTLGSWSQTIPAGTDPLYVTTATAVSSSATDTILTSEWAVVRVLAQNGSPGAAGAPATSAYLTNEAVQLFAYATGVVTAYTGATGDFKVFAGSTDISANFSLSTLANPQGLTIGYSGRTYTVTAGFDANEDTATVTIRATGSGAYAGVVLDKVLSLSKAKGGYEIVAALPSTNLFSGRVVFNEADDKLYRYTGTAWTAAVPAADVAGQLVDTQIQAVSASKIAGLLANSQIEAVAAAKVTGQLSDAQLAAISAAKLTGQIVGTQITDGSVTTAKVAAGAITAGQIAADTITAANIAAGAVTASELAAGSVIAGKVAAGAISATELAANSVVAGKIAANAVSANEIAANAVRVQHLLVTLGNLNPDPQFRDLNAWLQDDQLNSGGDGFLGAAPTGWFVEEIANAQSLGIPSYVGSRWIQLWSGKSGQNNNARYALYGQRDRNNRFAVTPGQILEIKAGVMNNSNQTIYVAVEFDDANNGGVAGVYDFIWSAGESSLKSKQFTVPNNCAWGRLVVFNFGQQHGAPTYDGRAYVGNISVRDTVGATMVVDGSIIAGKIAANAITADKIEAGAVTAAKVAVTQLSAISATIGLLRTATSGQRLEIENNQIRVYDGSNVLRVRMGIW